jgi:sugar-specific transcriptional regulator TrmB
MQKVNQILENFSFSEPEAKIYTSALRLGKTSVSEVAQKSEMGRTAAYFHIKNLIEKGILNKSQKGKKAFITAIKPFDLAEKFQKNLGNFKTLIPQLEALNKVEEEIPQIEVLESKTGFHKVYDEITSMPQNSEFKVIESKKAVGAELTALSDKSWEDFFEQIVNKKLLTKAIFTREMLENVNQSMTPKNYKIVKKRMWNIRTLSEEQIPLKNLVMLYNNKCAFLFPETSLVITIKHKGIYDILDTLFETVFSFSEKIIDPWG